MKKVNIFYSYSCLAFAYFFQFEPGVACKIVFLLPDNERSISQIEASLNPCIQGVINLKNYEHLRDKRKYFDAYHICCRCNCAANLLLFLKWMVKPHFIFFALFLLLWALLSSLACCLLCFTSPFSFIPFFWKRLMVILNWKKIPSSIN